MADYPKLSHRQKRSRNKSMENIDCKTPPLPTSLSGIEDLIKRRDYLKKKIQHIENNPKGNQTKKQKLFKDAKKHEHIIDNSEIPPFKHDRQSTSDSENEETIINQRRQQRQKILEKFNQVISHNDKDISIPKLENDCSTINKDVDVVPARKTRQEEVVDMFSELNEFTYINPKRSNIEEDRLSENVHDDKGYYCVRIGDTLKDGKYIINGLLGQGVFANVVRAHDKLSKNIKVAIKIIRKNDLILKNSIREVSFLKQINNADPNDKHHCVKFLGEFKQKGHLCIVLELLHMNLRSFIKTLNKSGLSMTVLKTYTFQLLSALQLLTKLKIIHADIKPDNILIDESRKILKLCDFGSATHSLDTQSPYLVSRYYRAPEIILGAPYDHGVDIWSLACTIFEMATGRILFIGSNNNNMLKAFIDLKGRFPARVVRKGIFKAQHFNQFNEFIFHEVDSITGKEKTKVIRNEQPTRDLLADLKKHCKKDLLDQNAKKLFYLKDLLEKMTVVDPISRISAVNALKHQFLRNHH